LFAESNVMRSPRALLVFINERLTIDRVYHRVKTENVLRH
jgi:hypothetical protein